MPRLLARRGAQQLGMTGHLCCWNLAVAGRAVAPRLLLTYSVLAMCLPTCRNAPFSNTWCGVRMLLALLLHSTDCLLRIYTPGRAGLAQIRSQLPAGVDGWGYSLKGMMGMVVVGGLLITATYYAMQRKVVPKVQALQKVRPAHQTQRPWLAVARACAGAGYQGCSSHNLHPRPCVDVKFSAATCTCLSAPHGQSCMLTRCARALDGRWAS